MNARRSRSHAAATTAPEASAAGSMPPPFFVLGCVRSGTTMLRDVLRLHPNLACPEETHFFRWGDPFGTDGLSRTLSNNAVLKKHRELDGITEEEFRDMLHQAQSRGDLYQRYMSLYMQRKKPGAQRWFDKTPQNVYGAMLAATTIQKSRFVHIVRNPLNVVASLRIGRIVKVDNLVGAANYWNEAVAILRGLKRAYPGRLCEIRYEDFVADPAPQLRRLCSFLNEPYEDGWFSSYTPRQSDHTEEGVLSPDEVRRIEELCRSGMRRYGYLEGGSGDDGDDDKA